MSKLRPLGDVTGDLEHILVEMGVDHDLQYHEILALVYAYLEVHLPGQREEYEDGTNPIFYYGPKGGLK